MPWQSELNAVAYELDEEATELASSRAGKFAPRLWYRECRVTVPRQSGKTQEALGRHVHRQRQSPGYGWSQRPPTIYMAQTASDARDKLVNEWFPILEDSAFDGREEHNERALDGILVRQFLRANGLESVRWDSGGRIITKPPSRKGGHGVSAVGLVDLDEAFAHQDADAEQGLRPAMVTSICPQIWIVSTAGDASSSYLWAKVEDGRNRCESGEFGRVLYLEYSAPEGADLADPAVRVACHPAVGYTIEPSTLDAEYDAMDLSEYARAYANVWTSTVSRIIPASAWAACRAPEGEIPAANDLYLAVDASPGGTEGRRASIGVGGWNQYGVPQCEIVKTGEGLGWVAPAVAELTNKWRTVQRVYVNPTGPVRSILPDLKSQSYVRVEETDAADFAAACGRWHQDVLTTQFNHRGQPALDKAVEGVAKRQLLDSWAWARRQSTADISPVVVATLVHWACVNHPVRQARIQ
jgi:hypothetical protein